MACVVRRKPVALFETERTLSKCSGEEKLDKAPDISYYSPEFSRRGLCRTLAEVCSISPRTPGRQAEAMVLGAQVQLRLHRGGGRPVVHRLRALVHRADSEGTDRTCAELRNAISLVALAMRRNLRCLRSVRRDRLPEDVRGALPSGLPGRTIAPGLCVAPMGWTWALWWGASRCTSGLPFVSDCRCPSVCRTGGWLPPSVPV